MLSIRDFFIYLFIMAGVTYLIRALPLVIFKGKITKRFAFIKRMMFYFVYLSNWNTICIVSEMTQYSPINECLSLFVT